MSNQKSFKVDPDLGDVLEAVMTTVMRDINCVQVGQIEGYNKEDNTAMIKLLIKRLITDENGVKKYRERPVLLEVPCVVLHGGTARITFPIETGDQCLVFFNDRDITNWYLTGVESTPKTIRMHNLSDGFALVGVRSGVNPFSSIIDDGSEWSFNSTNKITIKDGNVIITTDDLLINGEVTCSTNINVPTGSVKCLACEVTTGATGAFLSADGKTVTVLKGIVTSIV